MSNAVPLEWVVHRQGDVCEFSNGRAYKLTEWETEGTPVIRLQNLTGSGKDYYYSNLILPDRQYCEKGDLLYMWSATFGPHLWAGPKAIYHYHIWKVMPDEVSLTRCYSFHLLGYKTDEWLTQSNGMGILHVTKGSMEGLPLTLPPLPEQKKIAAILSSVDDVIAKTQAQIDKLKDLKIGMMQELLTKGIGHTKFKDSAVGLIPARWDIVPLVEFSLNEKYSFVNGPFGSDLLSSELKDSGVPVIYVRDLKGAEYSRVSTACVTDEKADSLPACNVIKGDVVIAKVGDPPCSSGVYEEDSRSIVTQDVIRIRPDTQVDSFFLSYLLNSSLGRKQIGKIEISGTRTRVSLTELKKLFFPRPSYEEQVELGNIFRSVDRRIEMATL